MQTLQTPAGERLIVLTEDEYEDLIDTRDAKAAHDAIVSGRMETFSEDEVTEYLNAASPLAFWRKWRGVAAAELAAYAGISEGYLAELEAGRAVADVLTYARLARRLRTHIESLFREPAPLASAEAAE